MRHTRTVEFGGGGADAIPDLSDRRQVADATLEGLAIALLLAAFEHDPDDSASRLNVLNAATADLSREVRTPLLRKLAAGWQLLEHAKLVCRDPEQSRGDWWFLTGAGRGLLSASAPVATLKHTLGG
jgi:hypothetical protein